MLRARHPRRAVTLVECAIVYPLTFLLLLGLIVGAMGMFRYQEMASLAREAARYASVHGTLYARDSGNSAPTPTDIYTNVVVAEAVSLDLRRLSYSITYDTSNSPYHVVNTNGLLVPVNNTVQVTLTYQWIPEYLLGGISMTSTSIMPMTY